MGCSRGCSIFWTFLYFLSGLALFGMGIWTAVDDRLREALVMESPWLMDNKVPWRGVIGGLIALGAYGFIVGILGMAGSACDLDNKIKNSLIAFAVLASIGVIGAIVYSGIATSHFAKEGEDDIIIKMKENLVEYFDLLQNSGEGDEFSRSWNNTQVEKQCCGVQNVTDYRYTEEWNTTGCDTAVPPLPPTGGCRPVPVSCCVLGDDGLALDEAACFNDALQTSPPSQSAYLHLTGCHEDHYSKLKQTQMVHMAMGWTCVFVQIVALIASGCLKQQAKDSM